jgi:hypothetical protein
MLVLGICTILLQVVLPLYIAYPYTGLLIFLSVTKGWIIMGLHVNANGLDFPVSVWDGNSVHLRRLFRDCTSRRQW